jgi:hypothetical protein
VQILPLTKKFEQVKHTAIELAALGAPIDVKVLLLPENSTTEEIESIFKFAKEIGARLVHFRPAILQNYPHHVTIDNELDIKKFSNQYGIKYNLALGRLKERTYTKCHQFFLFPSFCADGKIYLCCEQKGNLDLCLGSWVNTDWRSNWCNDLHKEIYNNYKLDFCKPCRPNTVNNNIQEAIVNTNSILKGFI